MTAPRHPIPAALAVVPQRGRLLLVRRSNPPDAGLWGYPGGKIDWGESAAQAAIRELREETGVIAEATETLACLDVIKPGRNGETEHHYLLVATLCAHLWGEPVAADDVSEAAWIPAEDIAAGRLPMSEDVDRVARLALERM